jgi:hypothetical protein
MQNKKKIDIALGYVKKNWVIILVGVVVLFSVWFSFVPINRTTGGCGGNFERIGLFTQPIRFFKEEVKSIQYEIKQLEHKLSKDKITVGCGGTGTYVFYTF